MLVFLQYERMFPIYNIVPKGSKSQPLAKNQVDDKFWGAGTSIRESYSLLVVLIYYFSFF